MSKKAAQKKEFKKAMQVYLSLVERMNLAGVAMHEFLSRVGAANADGANMSEYLMLRKQIEIANASVKSVALYVRKNFKQAAALVAA